MLLKHFWHYVPAQHWMLHPVYRCILPIQQCSMHYIHALASFCECCICGGVAGTWSEFDTSMSSSGSSIDDPDSELSEPVSDEPGSGLDVIEASTGGF